MPMKMRERRLFKAIALFARFSIPFSEKTGLFQHTVDAAGTSRRDILVQHHVGATSITFRHIAGIKLDDGGFLPIQKPVIFWNISIVTIRQTSAFSPFIIFAWGYFEPFDQLGRLYFSPPRPALNIIHDLIPDRLRRPGSAQLWPRFFFS